jgi:hypothetical protein
MIERIWILYGLSCEVDSVFIVLSPLDFPSYTLAQCEVLKLTGWTKSHMRIYTQREVWNTLRSLLFWPLKVGPIGCPETSVTTHLLCITAQKREGIIYTHHDRSLKSRMEHLVGVMCGVHEHPLLIPCTV